MSDKLKDPELPGEKQATSAVRGTPKSEGIRNEQGEKIKKAATLSENTPLELPPALEKKLRKKFDENIAMWDSLGLFTSERERKGYKKPTFDQYKAGFAKYQELTGPGEPTDFKKGYDTVIFVPMDLPLISDDPEEQTMISLLRQTLIDECRRTAKGKPANSLVIQTRRGKKQVIKNINDDDILSVDTEYIKNLFHRRNLQNGAAVRMGGSDLEYKNGCIVRLDRSAIILHQDVSDTTMTPQNWRQWRERERGKSLPADFKFQTLHEGIAFLIAFIKKHHYIPDALMDDGVSQSALMIDSYESIDKEGSSEGTPELYFADGEFYIDKEEKLDEGDRNPRFFYAYSTRGGLQINEL